MTLVFRRWRYAAPPLWVVLATQFLMGVAAGPLNPILSTAGFIRIPAAMRGRVFGVMTAGAFVGMPLGVLVAGFLLESVGVRFSLLITGAIYLLATVMQAFIPAFREMDSRTAMDNGQLIMDNERQRTAVDR